LSPTAVHGLVLGVYLLLLAGIGVATSRRLRSSEDFLLGGRRVGPWVTALSYVAAYFSSVVIIGGGAFGYQYGMATLWVGAINVLVGCTLAWIVLGRRLRRFTARLGTMTVPGFLGERFGGREVRIFSAVVIALFLVVYNVSILKGMGHVFEVLMGLPYWVGVLLSGAIIVLYVSLGGYMAVVWTGFFQAWVMGAGLILLAVAALRAAGGLSAVTATLAATDPGLVYTPGIWGWAGLISYSMIVSFGVWGMPQLLVRFYSIRSVRQLRIGAVVATIGGSLALLPYMIGAVTRAMVPGLENADLAIPVLTKAVLSPWGSAIFLAGVIAAGMSTFASVLIITSGAVVRDFVQKGLGRQMSERQSIRWSRVVSLLVGVISLAIALRPPALVLVLTAFSWAAIASTCLWPILFGIFSRWATRAGVFASMIGGLATALVWIALGSPFGVHGFLPGIGVSLVFLLVVSLISRPVSSLLIDRAWGAGNAESGSG